MIICPDCRQRVQVGILQCSWCRKSVPQPLPDGTLLHQHYRVVAFLGQGGFGVTYRGSDEKVKRPVAIKEYFPLGCARQGNVVVHGKHSLQEFNTLRQKFIEEARTIARLNHPAIVKVYDVFQENNTAYMVMEYIHGKTLFAILEEYHAQGMQLPEREAVQYIIQTCEALEVVHHAGLIHRDFSPANIMRRDNGSIVLIDFGAAREMSRGTLTYIGTPLVAAPEQALRRKQGEYTDVYALGATLYWLLTGNPPPVDVEQRLRGARLPSVRSQNPHVSESVEKVVMWAMEMEPSKRPQNVRVLADALRQSIGQSKVRIHAPYSAAFFTFLRSKIFPAIFLALFWWILSSVLLIHNRGLISSLDINPYRLGLLGLLVGITGIIIQKSGWNALKASLAGSFVFLLIPVMIKYFIVREWDLELLFSTATIGAVGGALWGAVRSAGGGFVFFALISLLSNIILWQNNESIMLVIVSGVLGAIIGYIRSYSLATGEATTPCAIYWAIFPFALPPLRDYLFPHLNTIALVIWGAILGACFGAIWSMLPKD